MADRTHGSELPERTRSHTRFRPQSMWLLLVLLLTSCAGDDTDRNDSVFSTIVRDESATEPSEDSRIDSTDATEPSDRPAIAAGRPTTTMPPVVTAAPTLDPVPDRAPPRQAIGISACDRTLRTGDSIQDAIDAISDRRTPRVLCLDGEFSGGGAPSSPDRPGVGPYHGTIVISDRENLTLRGRPGSIIRGIARTVDTPEDDASPDEQHPFDQTNLIKVVDSSNIVLEGLTIDGFVNDRPALNRLIWFQNVSDSVIRFNVVRRGGGECIRIKSNSTRNVIHNNLVEDCGVFQAQREEGHRLRKNGEGIYIGTDPRQVASTQINRQRYWGLDPALVTDRSSYNWVHANIIAPGRPGSEWGNECVDVKEDWERIQTDLDGDAERGEPGHNMVSHNVCSGQFDPESGGFDSRGPNNSFEHNLVTGVILGASIRVGAKPKDIGDAEIDWRAPANRIRLNVLASHGTEAAVKAWDDQPLAAGSGVCGNVDADGSSSFDDDTFVSDDDAGVNLESCADDPTAAGPTVPVGPDLADSTAFIAGD